MRVNEFDYYLPKELIAQEPLISRSASKMLVLNKKTGSIEHKHFYDIIDMLNKEDVLVINNTKVLPSRIYGKKIDTDAKIEVLLLKELSGFWECLIKPARRVKVGTRINFSNLFMGTIIQKLEDGMCHISFKYDGIFLELLEKLGEMPLPPYIHKKLADQDRYQTVYAKELGSAAAPTAGLHFTEEILSKIKEKGITICNVTLNIGLGTFKGVSEENIEDHKMHTEYFRMSKETAEILNNAKKENKRIIAVGTTSVRTIESIYGKYKKFVECAEDTNIFIYPGYEFLVTDALITNFHLPKSTLVMLVSAFSSKDIILNAYKEAINNKYRFFSFGDAMFIR
ncbi:MAG: tRNA preQ1(34) S-adenosylmethionine ribosyltransferase-isomerase QueA [Bacilli bacterium]|jgi:S-adenosylmethionine:tRNA ribosyltransferase-isomerase|nr:tRNA preQ1(34) S-adenosylmethionine ribosyltransferase-isomerase QueA [Bacilli bacterium]MDD2681424.1 tRNA preQ1(34) S-adenosylmethionine ribosyltransferase-isomerase QueA [Bacilli bacterium]MDD3121207.1 tRNA preQ1(34) S-adenosylmethionine ribosyltransferase-isomerase QueA [Bacilli bacterium]MDD4062848.1 tRNA preQ1(34) S-adenosylmethionine ribosyltransferase-isomerase QueA [Bacilli bacterium]MDD5182678.1 tRNA preQ1(34) S-adenosylmethionine ribosyltransferase-isomerase QueA [Bacilli bacterium